MNNMTTQKTMRKTKTPAGTTSIKTQKVVKRVKLPPNPFIHEILEHVEGQKTKAKKIEALREYRDDSLEGLHPEEAKIICLVKDKSLTDKYKITKDMVVEAFPDIKWSDRV